MPQFFNPSQPAALPVMRPVVNGPDAILCAVPPIVSPVPENAACDPMTQGSVVVNSGSIGLRPMFCEAHITPVAGP